jgi:hypothetical protein
MRNAKGTVERAQSAGEPVAPKQSSVLASHSDDDDSEFGSDGNMDDDNNLYDNDSVMANGNKQVGPDGVALPNSAMTKAKNREHARNTRIRRKNFIETLKDDILQVSTNRENRDRDRRAALSKLADQVGGCNFTKNFTNGSNIILIFKN